MDQMGQMGMYQGQMGMAQQQAPPAQSMGGNEGPPGCNLFIYHCPPSVRAVHARRAQLPLAQLPLADGGEAREHRETCRA